MYSIKFPDMFSSTKTNLVSDHQATSQNLDTVLKSDKSALFGDPYFGTKIKKLLFEQNSAILQDLLIDEIYTAILAFMPQIKVNRNNIKVTSDGYNVYATVTCVNLLDYQIDTYEIKLTEDDNE